MEDTANLTPPLARRRFGTLLTANSPPRSSSTRKKARVVRTTYTVTFDAGPLGLQLEPTANHAACRVQGFSSTASAARSKGCIQPGDIVTTVNGHGITSYQQAIALLKAHEQQERVIVLQRPVVASHRHESSTASKQKWPGVLKRITQWNAENVVNGQPSATASPEATTSTSKVRVAPPITTPQSRQHAGASSTAKPKTPQGVEPNDEDVSWMIQSADDLVLLSHNVQSSAQRLRFASHDTVSPRMTQSSPNGQSSFVLSVEDMLEHDFGSSLNDNTSPRTVNNETISSHAHQSRCIVTADTSQSDPPLVSRNNAWQEEKQSLLKQIQNYQQQVSSMQDIQASEKQRFESEIQGVKQTLEKTRQELEASRKDEVSGQKARQDETSALRLEVESYRQQLQQSQNTLAAMENTWRSEKEQLSQELQSSRRDAEHWQKQCLEATQKAEQFESQLAKRQQVVDNARLERDGALQTVQQKSQLAKDLSRQLEHSRQSAATAEHQLEQVQSELAAIKQDSTRTKQHLTETIQDLQKQLQETRAQRQELVVTTQQELTQSTRREQALKHELDRTRVDLQQLQEQTNRDMMSIRDLEARVQQVDAAHLDAEQRMHQSQQTENDLLQRLEASQKELQRAQTQAARDSETIIRLEQQLDESNLQHSETQQDALAHLQKLQAQLTHAQSDMTHLRENMERDLAAKQSHCDDLKAQLESVTAQIDELNLSYKREKTKWENLRSEHESELSMLRDTLYNERERTRELSNVECQALEWKQRHTDLEAATAKERTERESQHKQVCEQHHRDIGLLDAECEKIEEELKAQSEANDAQLRRIESFMQKMQSNETRIAELSTQVDHKDAELKEALNMIELLETQLQSVEEQEVQHANAVTESHLAVARHESSELKRSLDEYQTKYDRVCTEKEELNRVLASNKERMNQLQETLDGSLSEVSHKVVEIASLQSSLEDTKSELSRRCEELKTCHQSISRLESERDTLVRNVARERESSAQYNTSLAEELIATRNDLADARKQNSTLDRLLRSMRRNVSDSERRASTVREQLEAERKATNDLKSQLLSTEREMQAKLDGASTDLEQLREKAQQIEQERNQLHQQVKSAIHESEELGKNTQAFEESYQKKLSQWEMERSGFLMQISAQKKEISDLSERLRDAKAESEASQREISNLRREFAGDIQAVRLECETKCVGLEEAVRDKDKQLRAMDKLETDLRIARRELSRTQQSLQSSKEHCDTLSCLLDEAHEECSSKIAELNTSHQSELQRMVKLHRETDEELNRTRKKLYSVENDLRDSVEDFLRAGSEHEKVRAEKNKMAETISRLEDEISEKSAQLDAQRLEMEAGTDDQQSPFKGLSSRQLRERCHDITNELERVQVRLDLAEKALTDQKTHNQQLSAQQSDLQNELGLVSESLQRAQAELLKLNEAKKLVVDSLGAEKDRANRLQSLVNATREQLIQSQREAKHNETEMLSLKSDLQETLRANNATTSSLKIKIEALEEQNNKAEQQLSSGAKEARSLKSTVASLREQLEDAEKTLEETQQERDELSSKYQVAIDKVKSMSGEIEQAEKDASEKLGACEAEATSLKERLSEMEVVVDGLRSDVDRKSEKIELLSNDLDKSTKEFLSADSEREETRSALTQAMQQAKSNKEELRELNNQISELEREKETMASQIENLRTIITNLEESSDVSMQLKSKQIQEAEEKYSALSQERHQLNVDLEVVREDLRDSRRQIAEKDGHIKSFRSRVANLSETLERLKADLQRVNIEKESACASNQELVQQVESKTREVDQLKAQVQVLKSSLARKESDYALLHESSERAVPNTENSYDPRDDEIARLQSKLQSLEAKLSSLSQVHKSQQQVLSLSQALEGQLEHFVEDVLHRAGDSIFDIASQLSQLEESCSSVLADANRVDSTLTTRFESILKDMSAAIPSAKAMLEEKHEQLETWKRRRALRVAPDASSFHTPDSKNRSGPESPSVLLALEKMKQVLDDEILTPYKAHKSKPRSLDTEYLQKVVFALESQIDSLLLDLQSAKEELKAKDLLFSDQQQLLNYHENERDDLERKLELTKESLVAAEAKIQELSESAPVKNDGRKSKSKLLAGQMIAKFVEDRALHHKTRAFRQWYCSCHAAKAASLQNDVEALTLELATMREKFFILKKHLKKSRRGKGQMPVGLDSILEENAGEQVDNDAT